MGKPALAGTGCAAIHNLQICDRFQDDFAEYVNCFGFSSPPPVAFLQVIFVISLSFPAAILPGEWCVVAITFTVRSCI
ncbi:hypothetical protein ACM3NY_09830 [Aeromonas veronii]|uniref:hypothetical protein n=1 Tax=Aeromonas veronii TaxID=654 RepID=UPI0007B5BB76|nr:hypothetical protein A6033_14325 [Aeromonas veronii]